MVEADKFLSLSLEQLVELISSDELLVPSKEKVSKLKIDYCFILLLGNKI